MTTDARALIEEGRRQLAVLETSGLSRVRAEAWDWLCKHHGELIEGYSAALDEMERLRTDLAASRQRAGDVESELARVHADTSMVDEIGRLRTSLAEQAFQLDSAHRYANVLERDKAELCTANEQLRSDLEASRAINRHYEQEHDSWGEAYKQRAAKTDARIKELEEEVDRMRKALQRAHLREINNQ
jgi:predicted nuclease with TOPRIM domain